MHASILRSIRYVHIIMPIINGLSDHDAQLLMINDVQIKIRDNIPHYVRSFNQHGILDFKTKLSLET